MLTKDVSQELETVFTSLHQQGKEPTVALVKARLTTSIPMPAIIAAIKSWKNAQRIPKIEVATKQNDSDRVAKLESQVAELLARVTTLEAQLADKEK
ncbi:hypothetical protein L9W73_06775 [Vibrio aestuarianus]|uniref:KfrA N-terminal DNA-binding domain-containing protein n=1 Tax=Vibrio aestuarianus TaxID=28171 RepID=A0A9X4FJN1_9VIBR|nr:hypothetical protein [Vibrio aestuarianus]MDE1309001.1 hypothetical protein [Vibrio aestuarianus]MDE1357011.1 hypothetical protein [Vibrio aestuarianus]NGZ16595.1 hypothetical protein [Vibrio aestuarianus]NGZ91051.1 hypothetical protein [Vibrio aestuarianus subsp. cardii]